MSGSRSTTPAAAAVNTRDATIARSGSPVLWTFRAKSARKNEPQPDLQDLRGLEHHRAEGQPAPRVVDRGVEQRGRAEDPGRPEGAIDDPGLGEAAVVDPVDGERGQPARNQGGDLPHEIP